MAQTLTNQAPSVIEWGAAGRPMPGQLESGDLHLVQPFQNGALVAAVDGLGHGEGAAEVARAAVAVLSRYAHEPVITLIKRCHQQLRLSRGAVMSLASFSSAYNTMTWVGVGNVEGVLLRADPRAASPRENVLLFGGLVGLQLPPLRAEVIPVSPGDLLIFTTDGISSESVRDLIVTDGAEQIAHRICTQRSKGTDDALVVVARYLGEAK